ncbi:MAG TPA: site-specific DNA-methyltransferase, partial [Acidimicrobiales bacterium]|nr:site-specific DNA-methyltransferase [Acidimicrobiales bacterium]
ATLDLWHIRPESARRVHHPAPFPVELPQRLIELYTFKDDLVLDPFLGSGTTAVAAVRTDRRYVGYDTDPAYIALAKARVAEERKAQAAKGTRVPKVSPVVPGRGKKSPDIPTRAREEGKAAQALAADILEDAGFEICQRNYKVPRLGLLVNLVANDAEGEKWYFDVTGAFTSTRGGLFRTEALWKCLGRASVLATCDVKPVVLLSSHLPSRRSTGDRALRQVGPGGVFDVMDLLSDADRERLASYAEGGHRFRALPGFWTPAELGPAR